MNINPLDNTNINQQNYNARKDPNFTSVIPIKVCILEEQIVNGEKIIKAEPITGSRHIRKVIRTFINMATKPAKNDKMANEVSQFFSNNDFQFKNDSGIKRVISPHISYLFTGPHAIILSELGKQIGRARRNPEMNEQVAKAAYYNHIKQFITNGNGLKYKGKDIGLHINLREKPKLVNGKEFKFEITNITHHSFD